MRILTNELKYAKLLRRNGFKPGQAESIISMISEMEILNVYSKSEIDIMLSEAVEKVFSKNDRRLEEQRREFDARLDLMDKYYDRKLTQADKELVASRRWLIGTVITVGMGIAAYLSTIINISH